MDIEYNEKNGEKKNRIYEIIFRRIKYYYCMELN
jgi:hypothetical protein